MVIPTQKLLNHSNMVRDLIFCHDNICILICFHSLFMYHFSVKHATPGNTHTQVTWLSLNNNYSGHFQSDFITLKHTILSYLFCLAKLAAFQVKPCPWPDI